MTTASEMRKTYAVKHNAANADHVAKCTHVDGLYWYAAPADEKGWLCVDCGWSPGEDPGYSPEHDRSHIETKVGSILHDLADNGIVYVGSSSNGESLTSMVVAKCKKTTTYDSVSIARFILEIEGDKRHAEFWRERGQSIIAGKDNRNRCACGKLSHSSRSNGDGTWTYECDDCSRSQLSMEPF